MFLRKIRAFASIVFATMPAVPVAACLIAPQSASAAERPRLALTWHAQYGGPATDVAYSVAISQGQVFTIGGSDGDDSCFGSPYYTTSLNCKLTVWANSIQSGTRTWTYKTPGRAEAVATGKGKVFVVGAGTRHSGINDFRIVALDQKTGDVAWSDGSLPPGTIGGEAFAVAVSGNLVFAVGCVFTGTEIQQSAYFIRAYDTDTGAKLWEQQGAPKYYQGIFFGVAAANGKVVVSGEGAWNWLVQAYDASTGAGGGAREVDSGFGFDEAKPVVIRGSTVFAVGELAQKNTTDIKDAYAQAYDLNTGTVLWSSLVDSGGFDALYAVAASAHGLYTGGTSGVDCTFFNAGTCPLYMSSLDPASGAILWQDYLDTTGVGQVTAVGVSENYVYMTGQGGVQCFTTCQVILRTYKAKSGKVVSTKYIDFHGEDNTYPALAIADGYLLLVGSTQTKKGDYDAFISAYKLPTDPSSD